MKLDRLIKILLFIVLWLCMISCKKQDVQEVTIVTVKKGDHNITPYIYREGKNIDWEYIYDFSEAKYDFLEPLFKEDDPDFYPGQFDYSKVGIKQHYEDPKRDSEFCGVRYNKWLSCWEFDHYSHGSNKERTIGGVVYSSSGIVHLKFYQVYDALRIDINGNVLGYYCPPEKTVYLVPFFFGGNRAAPKDLKIKIIRIK